MAKKSMTANEWAIVWGWLFAVIQFVSCLMFIAVAIKYLWGWCG